ncbi:MAG: ABC transporter substrate-binding protein, partial [Halomonadaceae bacterium]|nr:ABC transporter substrate-binding protein [Halomonadaceae bacterium]
MLQPLCNFLANAPVTTVATALMLSLPALAEPTDSDPTPMPASSLELETEVIVFPALSAPQTTPLVEVPPAVEGGSVIQYLFVEPELPEAGLPPEAQAEPEIEVPVSVSEPAEPIVPPPVTQLSVTLDWYLNPQHATLLIAREKGLFQRHGLDVNLSVPADPRVATKLLLADRTDLVVGRQPQLHLLVDQELPVVRVATLIATPLSGLILPEAEAEELAIEGYRIGYTDTDGRDVMLFSALRTLLGTAQGLDLIEPVETSYRVLRALREQHVESALVHHRYLLPRQLADEGVATSMLPIEELGLPLYDGLILMANRERLNGRRDAMRRMIAALEEAALWIANQPQAAWALLEEAVPALADQANREAWELLYPRFAMRPAAVDHGRYLRLEQHLFDNGSLRTIKPVER